MESSRRDLLNRVYEHRSKLKNNQNTHYPVSRPKQVQHYLYTGKNGFVRATKLGTTNNFLLPQPKILLQQPNILLIELNILL